MDANRDEIVFKSLITQPVNIVEGGFWPKKGMVNDTGNIAGGKRNLFPFGRGICL